MSKSFTDNLVPEKEHGLPLSECGPFQTLARAIRIDSKIHRSESLYDRPWTSEGSQEITFEFKMEDKTYSAKQTFQVGDVKPVLGQWVTGIAAWNQWGSMMFVTTHLMKVKE